MKLKRSMIIAILIFAMFILTFRTGSHTINGYPSPEQRQALQDDYDNAETELDDWQNYINAVVTERQKHATIALYLHGQWLGTQSSIRNQQISALSGSVQSTIIGGVASAYGIAVKMATAMYSAFSLEDLMAYEIGQVNVLESDIEASWDNSVTVEGTDDANSIMEAYRDHVATVNHYNLHSSQSKKKAAEAPIKPSKWNMPKFPCGGSCGQEFDTIDSPHYVKCGTARNVEEEARDNINSDPNRYLSMAEFDAEISRILDNRSASDGCGCKYYDCNPSDKAEHQERTCKKTVWERPEYFGGPKPSYTCNRSFRKCMGHTFNHDQNTWGTTAHSGEADSGSDTEGSTQEQTIAPDPTPTPTPSYHTCGVHETWQSGDHSAAGCGVSGHYVCDGSDHTLQASCSVTNSNGDYCTYASFYACQSHTCVFPAPTVTCARNACGESVSDRLAHRIDCDNCDNHYWTCIEGATHNHTTTFTCRRSGCGVTFTKCSNGPCPESSAGNYHWAAD